MRPVAGLSALVVDVGGGQRTHSDHRVHVGSSGRDAELH